jgi:glycosyltransferase involved in cell wall biosynthesis
MKKVTNLLFNDFTNDNRVLKISRSLQNNGYDVTLVATHFNKKLPREEVIEGFKVKRFNVGRIKFLPLNLILFWFVIIKNFRKEKIFHCNDLYALPPAYIIKKFFNKEVKIVYDCHEHETEGGIYVGKPILKYIAKIFEKKMIGLADEVITVSDSIADEYVEMYGIDKPKLVLNSPPYWEEGKHDLFRGEFDIPEDKIIFLYQGKYMKCRGVEELVEIFRELKDKNKNLVLVFLLYGEGVGDLKKQAKGCGNIYFHDKVSVLEYMKYVSSADWGIFLLQNTCKSYDYSLANKVFDYIIGGLPVIVSNLKEMSEFVRKYEIGYTVNSEYVEGVVQLLETIDKEKKEEFLPNLKKVAREYCWEEQEKVLIRLYDNLIGVK